jgi:hypothetical protein
MKRRRRHMVRKKKGELKAVDIKRTGIRIRIRNPDPESGYAIGKNAGSGSASNQCGSETQKRGQNGRKEEGKTKGCG